MNYPKPRIIESEDHTMKHIETRAGISTRGAMKMTALRVLLAALAVFLCSQALHAEGEKIVFVRGGNIWIGHTSGNQERQLTSTGQDASPSLSKDGKWVIYHSGKDKLTGFGQLYLLPTEGGAPKKFDIKGIHAGQDPSFSFNGDSFVFVALSNVKTQGDTSRTHATASILEVDLVNLKHRTIVSSPNVPLDQGFVYDAPSYSPDQAEVVFQHSGNGGGCEIVDMKGKSLFRFPKEPPDTTACWRPRFSPDGTHILCFAPSTSEGATDTIYLVDIKRGKKKKLTEGANPTFVEGGKAIVFEQWTNRMSNTGTRADLWYMKLGPACVSKKIISNGSQPSD